MINNINQALQLNIQAYEAVKKNFQPGMSEKDVKQLVLSQGTDVRWEGDFVGGSRTSYIEGDATDYILKEGDALILDIQPLSGDICCDTCRTFFLGEPSQEVKDVYQTIRNAIRAGESVLREGVKACQVYETVREALAPYEEHFPHHAGHRVGEIPVVDPRLIPEEQTALQAGMIVTLEPGLYFSGRFGIRLENNYLITEDGCVNLFPYTLELEDFILSCP